MALFETQINFIKLIEREVFPTFQNTINSDSTTLENDITNDQLFERGVDGFERKLAGYARTTIRIKQRKGQPTDRTTLRDTREFHNRLTVRGFPLAMEITSATPYTQYLIRRYGEAIMRPSRTNVADFMREFYIPRFRREIQQQLK